MHIRHYLAASVAVISVVATMAAPAHAQQITTGIEGAVRADDGSPIGGATVVITDARTGSSRTLTTDSAGRFGADSLVVGGPYTVEVSANGYEGQSLGDIVTSLQGNTSLDFTLSAGSGDIVVTAARVRVAQLAVGPGISFSAEVLDSAPSFNRDIRDVLRLDPRVSLDRDDAGGGQDRISCLGGNDRGNAFTVDGIAQNDIYGLNDNGFSSRSSAPIPYDAVRETQVQFAPFDVSYGQFTGCSINAVTRSGTNEYRFGGFFEYSDNGLRGDSVRGVAIPGIEPDKRWGGWFGGPIFKDRLFIFGAYEHQEAGRAQDQGPSGAGFPNVTPGVTLAQFNQISEVISRVYGIDTGPIVTNLPFKNDRYFVRADWQINDDHRLEATYQRIEESETRADDLAITGTFGNTIVGRNTFYLQGTTSDYYSGRLYSQWTDKFSTELRYSRSEVIDVQNPIGGGEAQSDSPIPRIIVGIDNPGTTPDGAVAAGPGFSRSANDLQTFVDQYYAVAKLDLGRHKLKVGFELNRVDLFNLFVQNATGTLTFRSLADLEQGLLSPGTGSFNTTNSPANLVSGAVEGAFGNFTSTGDINAAAAQFTRSIYSVYAQDDIEVTDQLSAVLGVRLDWFDGGKPLHNPAFQRRYGFTNAIGFSDLAPVVMPRLGLTYNMDDFAVFRRPVIKGGVGIFSGGDPLVWFSNAFQNDGRGFAQGTTQSANCPTGQIDVVVNGQFTGVPTCIRQDGINSAARGLGDAQSISPNIKQPTVLRANIGFETGLDFSDTGFFSGWYMNLDYIYSKFRNPFGVVDLSQVPDPSRGLSGFTIDGRPIYRAIDPTAAGCSAQLVGLDPGPVFSGVTAACFATSRDDELQLTNTAGYESHIASIILQKEFDGGLFTEGGNVDFSFGYAFTSSQDRRNMFNSTATSNFDRSAVFDIQNPDKSRGFFGSRHNITTRLSFREEFFEDLSTRFTMSFVARSGRPYSLTFGGSGVFADSVSGSDNQLAYLPTGVTDPNIAPTSNLVAVQQLVDWASEESCASKFLGRTVPRNSCENDWYFDL
ncbi:MAG: TonB-dependent receptor, partial [Hyphomicrobiaceae bacterium]|nr:TonB-dependent receptor [Hyphomicrobiaceae bacterium]